MNLTTNDEKWMRKALELAEKGCGYVSPNPLVGCVIVSEAGRLIGKGWHERYGQAHAEVNAMKQVKDPSDLVGATVYVTLEPCAHHGKTPPCAEMLAKLPIDRVVVAMTDPNPQVNGKGIDVLRKAGKQVDTGLLEAEATMLNEVFLYNQKYGKAYVFLKMAQSVDGFIAAADGVPERFTCKESQQLVHAWRASYDGVMVGSTTALLDNPRLTVRLAEGRQPMRIVLDGPGQLPDDLHLFSDQYSGRTIRVSYKKSITEELDPMLRLLSGDSTSEQRMVVCKKNNHCDLREVIQRLPEFGVHSVMVEAGQQLATALLRDGLVDKMSIFIAPFLLGGGTRSVMGLGIDHLHERLKLERATWQQMGTDMVLTGYL